MVTMGTELNNNTKKTVSNGNSAKISLNKMAQMTLEIQSYDEPPGVERQYVVKLEDLEHYVKSHMKSGSFKEQYELLRSGPQKSCAVGKKAENKDKNRYQDLLPYDDSRVVLQKLKNDPHSDYINASYIDSYEKGIKYISTQGPLKDTVVEFWRMIWQEEVNVISMTANIIENGKKKCDKYWPDKVLKSGEITVTALGERVFLDYTIRNFKLQKVGVSGHRVVRQYHFTAWPDHGVPAYPQSLIMMLQEMKEYQKSVQARTPWVLHCSAGVGRTGTVMVLDSAMEMSKAESKVDVLGLLYRMRQQRINLIETLEQYTFVYRALVEYHFGDISCKPANEMVLYFNKLRQVDSETKKTGLELQFEKLRRLEPEHFLQKCLTATTENNKNKNRDLYILPPDHGRPVLKTNPPSNYINAVYTHDYCKPNHFVATQYPLPNTIADFWQLIWDTGACAVVVLNELSNKDEVEEKRRQFEWEHLRDGYIIREAAVKYGEETENSKRLQKEKLQHYKESLDKQRNNKYRLQEIYDELDEVDDKRAKIFLDAKQDMKTKHKKIKEELDKQKNAGREYVAKNLRDEKSIIKVKEEEILKKAIREAEAKHREECAIKKSNQEEALESIKKFYDKEMELKAKRELEEKINSYQERRKIMDYAEQLQKVEDSKHDARKLLEKEAQHLQLHQILKRNTDRKNDKLEDMKDYLNHMRSLEEEEEIFQKYAQLEIAECEARGINTKPMQYAARPGIECGKGPLYRDRGSIRPKYYAALSRDELNHIERGRNRPDSKSRLGFISR